MARSPDNSPPSPPSASPSRGLPRLLAQHPTLAAQATPVRSFPATASLAALETLRRLSERRFLARIAPATLSQDSPGPPALRLVESPRRDPSLAPLPYPDPELSIGAFRPPRPIAAMPSRPASGAGLADAPPSRGPASPAPPARDPPLSPSSHYPSAAAAISALVNPDPAATTMDQMWNEMQVRANLAAGMSKTIPPDPLLDVRSLGRPGPQDENRDRFEETHLKTFSKFDSITNHYAAKRKVAASENPPAVPSTSRVPLAPALESNKRQKTSDFGYSKPSVVAVAEQNAKEKQIKQRQLDRARVKRKSQTADAKKAGLSGPPTSGLRGLRTRLQSRVQSAVQTFKGALTLSSPLKLKFSSSSAPATQTGVGFGVPSGLGVGPAAVPSAPLPKKVIPQRATGITAHSKARLPPAGPSSVSGRTRPLPTAARSVSNSATYGTNRTAATKKRVFSARPRTAADSGSGAVDRRGDPSDQPATQRAISPVKQAKVAVVPPRSTGLHNLVVAGTSSTAPPPSNTSKTTPALPRTGALSARLRSPAKRAPPFGSASQLKRPLPPPAKRATWKPKTITSNTCAPTPGPAISSSRPIRPRPATASSISAKASVIPQPKARYVAKTQIASGTTGLGSGRMMRAVKAPVEKTGLTSKKTSKNEGSLTNEQNKESAKRPLDDEDDNDDEKPADVPPRSQKKIRI